MKATRTGTKWAHVSCALWIPEVKLDFHLVLLCCGSSSSFSSLFPPLLFHILMILTYLYGLVLGFILSPQNL